MTAEVFQNRWCHEEVLCSRPAESPSSEPRCLSQQAASLASSHSRCALPASACSGRNLARQCASHSWVMTSRRSLCQKLSKPAAGCYGPRLSSASSRSACNGGAGLAAGSLLSII